MSLQSISYEDETLEVLTHIQEDRARNIVCAFVDSAGNKVRVRMNPQAARDLFDELADLLSDD